MKKSNIVLTYNGKKCREINVTYKNDIDGQHVFANVSRIKLPFAQKDQDVVRFVILELITNSLRAAKEVKSPHPVNMELKLSDKEISLCVKDGAGGFDLSSLPYDINSDISKVNCNDDRFLEYREKNDYQKFGYGLYLVKSWSDYFDISFTDKNGNIVDKPSGAQVFGTKVVVKKNISSILQSVSA